MRHARAVHLGWQSGVSLRIRNEYKQHLWQGAAGLLDDHQEPRPRCLSSDLQLTQMNSSGSCPLISPSVSLGTPALFIALIKTWAGCWPVVLRCCPGLSP